MDFKDYYAILGVSPDADEQTIKQAYRKLARQYHPDVNPGDKQAEERFKEINEAYEALSDPEKRQKYETLRQQYQQWQQRGGRGEFNWNQWQTPPGERGYTRTVSPEDLEDLFGGDSPFSDFFGSIFGQSGRTYRAGPRRGRDIEVPVEITLEEALHGTGRTLDAGDRRIEARIPPGVRTGSRVRLSGQGSPGGGGQPGDLYLVVEVMPHPQFEREGDDLHIEVPVDIFTAAVGGQTRVPALDGPATLKIPPRTQADKTFRLRGKGMPRLERPGERGDLYAHVKLVLPERLSDAEFETLRTAATLTTNGDRRKHTVRVTPVELSQREEASMKRENRLLNQGEAAVATALDLAIVRLCAESGLIAPEQGYDEADLAELRRVRRLIEDLGLDHPAIEVVLRMRWRLLQLQAEVQRLETELRMARRSTRTVTWVDAEWTDLP